MSPRAIITDIEGTTSSIAFVHEVLFPYARVRMAAYVAQHRDAAAPILAAVREALAADDLGDEAAVAQLIAWQDADRKFGPLKTLQGMIWRQGYAEGALHGHVYADAVAGLRRWHAAGVALYVYSSGSVEAQKLLFGHSVAGDLTPLFAGHFDTAVGAKREAASYAAIARAIGVAPGEILFLSDVAAELEAARDSGMAVTLLARDGAPADTRFPVAGSFDQIPIASEAA